MSFNPILNHVALLVRSVEQTAEKLRGFGFFIGPTEKWEGEGTLEIYVGETSQRARLLLMEPYRNGAYQRALEKRGPGLHHIAIDVNDLSGYIDSLSTTGWLLHLGSVKSIAEYKTAWLVRPGVGALVEVQQREGHEKSVRTPGFITQVAVPSVSDYRALISALSCPDVVAASQGECHIDAQSKHVSVTELLS